MNANRTLAGRLPVLSPGWPAALFRRVADRAARPHALEDRMAGNVRIERGQRVLDLGCGAARLAMLLKKAQPGADVIGIDGDRETIASARELVRRNGLSIPLFDASLFDLPCRDEYFDRVFACVLFRHLDREQTVRTVREIFRVLRPGGELHVAGRGAPRDGLLDRAALLMRLPARASVGAEGLLPAVLREAGFGPVEETGRQLTVLGTLMLYRARKPSEMKERHERPSRP